MWIFRTGWFSSLTEQAIFCQEVDRHSLEDFSIDPASLIEGSLFDGRKYLFEIHTRTQNNPKVKDFSTQLSFLSSCLMSNLTVFQCRKASVSGASLLFEYDSSSLYFHQSPLFCIWFIFSAISWGYRRGA